MLTAVFVCVCVCKCVCVGEREREKESRLSVMILNRSALIFTGLQFSSLFQPEGRHDLVSLTSPIYARRNSQPGMQEQKDLFFFFFLLQ